jgi:putative phosphoesterase
MQQVALFGDTHVPSRADAVPGWVRETVGAADHAVHTGDFDSPEAHETVQNYHPDLVAVRGNMDPRDMGLPEVATLAVEDVLFVVTHGTGPVENYRERVAGVVQETAAAHDGDAATVVGVAGHTHQVLDEVVDGVRLLNPGSATGAAPASRTTMYAVTVDGADVSVELREE